MFASNYSINPKSHEFWETVAMLEELPIIEKGPLKINKGLKAKEIQTTNILL